MKYNILFSLRISQFRIDISVSRSGVVDRVPPAFQPGAAAWVRFPIGVKDFSVYPGVGCVSFVVCPVLSLEEVLTFC